VNVITRWVISAGSRWAAGSKLHVAHEIGRIVHAIQVDITFLMGFPGKTSRQQVPVLCPNCWLWTWTFMVMFCWFSPLLLALSTNPINPYVYVFIHIYPVFSNKSQLLLLLMGTYLLCYNLSGCLSILAWPSFFGRLNPQSYALGDWLRDSHPWLVIDALDSSYVPSGKHTQSYQSYCKWPFIVDLPIKNGGSFHSFL